MKIAQPCIQSWNRHPGESGLRARSARQFNVPSSMFKVLKNCETNPSRSARRFNVPGSRFKVLEVVRICETKPTNSLVHAGRTEVRAPMKTTKRTHATEWLTFLRAIVTFQRSGIHVGVF